ncbi:hypothetical protein B0H14DRAFT_3743331 [Mycena olivaceomarginata]|nr:hypothetical protein B0H14DRAFT_3743331 [Mycena olivaceomarginata]
MPHGGPAFAAPTAVRIARAKRQYRAGLDVPFASDRQRASRTCLGFEHRTPLVAPAPPSRPSPLGLAVGLGPARHDEGCRQRVHENPARDTHAPALARKWQHSCTDATDRASKHRVLAPDSLQRLALAPDSLDVRSLRTRLAARAPGLRSVFAQLRTSFVIPCRARLLPAAAANASDSRVLAQDRPLQMQLVLRCPSSHERCTPLTVHSRKSQGKLQRGGLETRVDWISDTTVQVTTEKLEGRGRSATLHCWRAMTLVAAIHAARWRLSTLARAPTRLSPRARSALASVLDSNHTSALPLAPDSPNLRSSRSCARAPPRALHPRPALAAVLCCLVPTQLCSLRVGLRDGVSNSAALLAGGIGGNGYYTSWEARLGPLVEADDAQVAPSLHRYDQVLCVRWQVFNGVYTRNERLYRRLFLRALRFPRMMYHHAPSAERSLTLTPSGRILKPCGRVRGRKLARSQRASTPVLGAGFASGAYPSSLCRTTYLSSERAWTLLDEERRTGTRLQANLEWGATWGAVYDHAASYSPLTFAGAGDV